MALRVAWTVATCFGTACATAGGEAQTPQGACAGSPAASTEPDQTEREPTDPSGGLGLSGVRAVLRDPNAPAPGGSPSFDVKISANAVLIGSQSAIPLSSDDVTERLHTAFRIERERVHAEGQGSLYALSVEGAVPRPLLAQVMKVAALAGWADARAAFSKGAVELHVAVPGPPGVEPQDVPEQLRWSEEALVIFASAEGTKLWSSPVVQVDSLGEALSSNNASTPTVLSELGADANAKSVADAIRSACGKTKCDAVALFMGEGDSGASGWLALEALANQAGSTVPHVEVRLEAPAAGAVPLQATRRLGLGRAIGGRMPKEAIQRIVRAAFGRMRGCYEAGLKRQPTLVGRVEVRFVIGAEGQVLAAVDTVREMSDDEARDCVVRIFSGLRFPAPEGGIVTVTYPIQFQQK